MDPPLYIKAVYSAVHLLEGVKMNDRNVLSSESLFESRHSKWLHLKEIYDSPGTGQFSKACYNCMVSGECYTFNGESHG